MKVIFWFVRIVVFVAVLGFALNNQHTVDLFLLPGATWHTPLVWAITGAFVCGALFGVLSMVPLWMRARKLAKTQTKQLVKAGNQSTNSAPTATYQTIAPQPTRGISSDELGV